jgi:hypothetical protein
MAHSFTNTPAKNVLLSHNPMWFTVSTDTTLTAKLRLNVEVYVSTDFATYSLLSTLLLAYNPFTSTCIFDVRKLIDDAIDIPQLGFYNGIGATPIVVKYYLKATEINLGEGSALGAEVVSSQFFAVKGGSNYFAASEASNYNYAEYYQNKFLTNMPKSRKVAREQALCFSFGNFLDTATTRDFRLKWLLSWDDGFSVNAYFDSLATEFGKINTFVFDDSLFEGYNSNPDAKLKRISNTLVVIDAGVETILDNITYTYEEAPPKRSRHFIWLNNLGGYDFLTCTGILEQSMEVKADLFQKVVSKNDYNSQEVDLGEVNFETDIRYKINTGMKNAGEIDGFLPFFVSKQTFLYRKDLTEVGSLFWFIPITKKQEGPYRKDRDYSYALGFEFAPLFKTTTPYVLK